MSLDWGACHMSGGQEGGFGPWQDEIEMVARTRPLKVCFQLFLQAVDIFWLESKQLSGLESKYLDLRHGLFQTTSQAGAV